MSEAFPAAAHYGTDSLTGRVAAALQRAGLEEGTLAWTALAPLDQFHVGGAAATEALAARLAPARGAVVLDVGSGLGGPSRALAATHGCAVTGIDLSQPFTDLATMLTERTGLAGAVRHVQGDATDLPFEPESFDLAWTQHVAMNIADRARLYAGILRVLRPGGRLALYDVVAGEGGPPHFPVPWARDPAHSTLLSADATLAALEGAGFTVAVSADTTQDGLRWGEAQAAAMRDGPPGGLGLPLVMGADFPALAANLGRSLREGRVRLLQAVAVRPS